MAVSQTSKFMEAFNRAPSDAVALDCASNEVRAVRMRKGGSGMVLTAVALLPPTPIPQGFSDDANPEVEVLSLPSKVRGRYAALLTPGFSSVIKMLRVPESFDPSDPAQALARMGVAQPDLYRAATRVIEPAKARGENRVLAVAMPERLAKALLALLPETGMPAPRSIELSDLAVLNAFTRDPAVQEQPGAFGFAHFDHDFSVVAVFNNGLLSQLRTFKSGAAVMLKKVAAALNVDMETASGVLQDGAFDITHMIEEDMRDMRGQYVICRDFMERSENCRVERLYLSGAPSLLRPFAEKGPMPETVSDWNVLDRFGAQALDMVQKECPGDAWRWTAAVGACLGLLESS